MSDEGKELIDNVVKFRNPIRNSTINEMENIILLNPYLLLSIFYA